MENYCVAFGDSSIFIFDFIVCPSGGTRQIHSPMARAGKLVDLVAFGYRTQNCLMITVYVIKSVDKKYRYVGITDNFERRFFEHNSGKNKSTRPYTPFKIIRTEKYNEARQREKFLKSGVGRKFLDNLK